MSKQQNKITINEIAKLAGVSKSTISRALDDNPRISDETKKKINEIINQFGYIPNATARSLARKKTNAIGIVIPQGESGIYSTTFFQEALKGICNALTNYGYDVLISSGNPSETEAIDRLTSMSKVDGIILLRSKVNDSNVELLLKKKFPFVLIGTCLENRDIYCVDNDNVSAAYDLTAHMAGIGKSRIAFIGGKDNSVVTVKRLEGYRKFLRENSLPVDEEYVKLGQFSEKHGYESMEELLNRKFPPDAVLIMDDTMCMGAVRSLGERGIHIPDEIAVACFNDSTYTRFSKLPFTAVSVDFYQLGMQAAETLVSVLEDKKTTKGCRYVGYNLIVRESTNKAVAQNA